MLKQALEIMQLRFHAYIFFIENWTHHLNVFVFTAHYVINSVNTLSRNGCCDSSSERERYLIFDVRTFFVIKPW